MIKLRIVFLFIVGVFLTRSLTAQSSLQQTINAVAQRDEFKHGTLGVAVLDIESGELLAGYNLEHTLIPASSLKTVTTATALSLLGPNYQFPTELQYDGSISSDGTLNGNLFIKGSGDPTLGSGVMDDTPDLEELVEEFTAAIKKAGIRRITGKIVGDASAFTTATIGDGWEYTDLGNYYGAGAWGLNIHENLFYLNFQQTSTLGDTPRIIGTTPTIPNLLFINEVTSAGANTGDNAYIYGGPYDYTRFVRGTIPVGKAKFTIKGSIPDPPFFAAHYLMQYLERHGVATSKQATTSLEFRRTGEQREKRKTFYTHYSPPLKEIAKRTNYESVNFYAESLLRAIGVAHKKRGSDTAGLEAIEAFWKGKGVDWSGVFLEDGSGLSGRNGITAFHLAKMMQLIAQEEAVFPAFYDSLPIAGVSGTVRYMLRGTAAVGRIRAKSGTLRRVRSYTGYARTRSGKLLAFCIMANNFTSSASDMRDQLEKIMVAMCR